ncbi:hypothetical protein J1614_003419 [Plenodomus biglobosus]|nr:hypothetical protein J1614_003419 [Plenodomus biglobosus]
MTGRATAQESPRATLHNFMRWNTKKLGQTWLFIGYLSRERPATSWTAGDPRSNSVCSHVAEQAPAPSGIHREVPTLWEEAPKSGRDSGSPCLVGGQRLCLATNVLAVHPTTLLPSAVDIQVSLPTEPTLTFLPL